MAVDEMTRFRLGLHWIPRAMLGYLEHHRLSFYNGRACDSMRQRNSAQEGYADRSRGTFRAAG